MPDFLRRNKIWLGVGVKNTCFYPKWCFLCSISAFLSDLRRIDACVAQPARAHKRMASHVAWRVDRRLEHCFDSKLTMAAETPPSAPPLPPVPPSIGGGSARELAIADLALASRGMELPVLCRLIIMILEEDAARCRCRLTSEQVNGLAQIVDLNNKMSCTEDNQTQ